MAVAGALPSTVASPISWPASDLADQVAVGMNVRRALGEIDELGRLLALAGQHVAGPPVHPDSLVEQAAGLRPAEPAERAAKHLLLFAGEAGGLVGDQHASRLHARDDQDQRGQDDAEQAVDFEAIGQAERAREAEQQVIGQPRAREQRASAAAKMAT